MSRLIAAVATSLVLVLGAGSAYLLVSWSFARQEIDAQRVELDKLSADLESLRDDANRIHAELEKSRAMEATLRARIAQLVRAKAEMEREADGARQETPEAVAEVKPVVSVQRGPRESMIVAVEEADALARQFLARGDVEGMWLLAADLLQFGEPGFEKFIELAAMVDGEAFTKTMRTLWEDEEVLFGPFFQTLSQNTEQILELGLYLDRRENRQYKGFVKEFYEELDDDFGPLLLGLYDGGNTQLLNAYVQRYRTRMGPLEEGRSGNGKDMIRALGQIRTAEAEDLLLDLLVEGGNPGVQAEAAKALAWQRSERALPALRSVRASTTDPKLIQKLDAAIRYLE